MHPVINIDIQSNVDHIGLATLSLALSRFLRANNFTDVVVNVSNILKADELQEVTEQIDSYLESTDQVIKSPTVMINVLQKKDVSPIKYKHVDCKPPRPSEEELKMDTVRPAYEGAEEYVSDLPVELRVEVSSGFRQSGRSMLTALAAEAFKKAGFEDVTIETPLTLSQSRIIYGDLVEQARNTPEALKPSREKILKNKIVLVDSAG